MRIPPSAIVMTLVIAVPFGFAIRDSLEGNDPQSKKQQAERVAAAQVAALQAEESARVEQEYEAQKVVDAKRKQTLATLIGSTPGSLGDRFGGKQVGMPSSAELESSLNSIDGLEDRDGEKPGLQLRGNGEIASLSFTIGDEHCGEIREAIANAWGAGEDDVWVDREHARRASLGGLLCVLHFDQIVDDKTWAKTALTTLIGKTPAQAQKLLGASTAPAIEGEDSDLSWYLPGATAGRESTELVASVAGGKITSTTASTTVSTAQAEALIAALSKQLGSQPVADETGNYLWAKTNVVASYTDSWRFTVSRGGAVTRDE
jgi:hypothetical protein